MEESRQRGHSSWDRSGVGGEGRKWKDAEDVWKAKLARSGDRFDVSGEEERRGKRTGRRIALPLPEVRIMEEGQVQSVWSSCVGGAFELSQRRCQTGYIFTVNVC